jgi:two-component system, cell cycle sensor histidine kinase and response regulator CckA
MPRRGRWTAVIGSIAVAVALVVLSGWVFGVRALTDVWPGWPAMQAAVAAAFLLTGIALPAVARGEASGAAVWCRTGIGCAAVGALLALASIVAPGRVSMPQATAWAFLLLDAALVLITLRRAVLAAQGLLALVLLAQLPVLLGYAYGNGLIRALRPFAPEAMHSALLLAALAVAALHLRPDIGPMKLATGPGMGGRLIRRLLPVFVVVLFAAGLVRSWGARAGLYHPAVGESVIVLLVLAVVTAAVWHSAAALTRIETERDRFFTLGRDLFCLIETGGRFARVNQAFTRALGWTAEELLEQPLLAFVQPEDRAATAGQLEALAAGLTGAAFENRVQTRDGEWRRISWTIAAGPKRRLFYATGRDVTELHEAERALRESEENLAITLRSIGDGVIATDAAGRVTRMNPAAERLTGWADAEAAGRSVGDVFRIERESTGEPAPVPVDEVLRTDETALLADHAVLVSRDGTRRPIGDSAAPIRDAEDVLVGVVMVFRDISAERGAERALQEINEELERRVAARTAAHAASEQRFVDLVEFAPDALFIVDADGRITLVNRQAERLFGWERQEMVGRALADLVPAAAAAALLAPHEPSAVPDEPWTTGEGSWRPLARRRDGSEFPIEIRLSPLQSGGDRLVVAAVRDMTSRAELEAQFLQAQKMESVGRLAGSVAHDFNNLLTVINSVAEIAATSLREDDPLAEDLRTIRDAGWRGADLTRQLLAFSRRQVLQPRVANPNGILQDLMPMLGRLLGESISLEFAPGADIWNVLVDAGQIGQVIMNLAVNARDAMPRGGRLGIETRNVAAGEGELAVPPGRRAGDSVLIVVADAGHGMDAETRRRIFEPFYSTKPAGRGTGLGLSTAYGIVKQSGGEVLVDSEPGVGTTFRVYLPRVLGQQPQRPAPKPSSAAVRGHETVLVVEDEGPLRLLAERILVRAGYHVLVAANGSQALDLIAKHRGHVDLVLSDLMMPGMSGPEMAKRVLAEHPDVRILYTSGYTDETAQQEGLETSAFFLAKPFSVDQLRAKIREVLDATSAGP